MKNKKKKFITAIVGILVGLFGLQPLLDAVNDTDSQPAQMQTESAAVSEKVVEGETYSTPEEVAAYLHEFEELPPNYLMKREAAEKGWDSDQGNLWEATDRMSIGGDRFGNYEGLLPEENDRQYYEADVNYEGGYRGPERLVYSNDGLIFYTDDHYESFKQLY